jgi:hypothetical protein
MGGASVSSAAFVGSVAPVRADIVAAHARFWERLAAPGSWWTGAERIAIAAETRAARSCRLCVARQQAVSPNALIGTHDRPTSGCASLPPAAVEAVHRITTDAPRLTRSFVDSLAKEGVDDARYVELLGVVVSVTSIDFVCRGVGAPVHPLPDPVPGAPSRYRPREVRPGPGFVPTIPSNGLGPHESDLWRGTTGNVIRAMSLVPDAVRDLELLGAAHYVPSDRVTDVTAARTLTRPQMELVAGRVSALNECFY